MSSFRSLLETVAGAPVVLTPQQQRMLFNNADVVGSNKMLRLLAARDDLVAELDEKIGEVRAAHVRAAWLTRPSRTLEEIDRCLAGETRSTVLAAIATIDGLPGDVYRRVLDAGRKHPRVLAELVVGPAPDGVSRDALLLLAAMPLDSLPDWMYAKVSTFGLAVPEWRRRALSSSVDEGLLVRVLRVATSNDLSGVDHGRVIELVLGEPLNVLGAKIAKVEAASDPVLGRRPRRYGPMSTYSLVTDWRRLYNTFVAVEPRLEGAMSEIREKLAGYGDRIEAVIEACVGDDHLSIRDELADPCEGILEIRAAANALIDDKGDVAAARTLARHCAGSSGRLETVASAEVRNLFEAGGLSADVFGVLVDTGPASWVVERYPDLGDPEIVEQLLGRDLLYTSPRLCEQVFESVDDPSGLLVEMASRTRLGSWVTEAAVKVHPGLLDTPGVLPASSLVAFSDRESVADSTLAAVSYLLDSFGDDTAPFELAVELAGGFVGTLGELVVMVSATVSDPPDKTLS